VPSRVDQYSEAIAAGLRFSAASAHRAQVCLSLIKMLHDEVQSAADGPYRVRPGGWLGVLNPLEVQPHWAVRSAKRNEIIVG
jgi:hypothetical protein